MINGKRYCTINTDAGIKDQIAGWAFWIRSEFVTHKRTALFKELPNSSQEAEFKAMVIGLCYVAKDEYLRSADVIVLNSDCKNIIEMIKNGKIWNKYPTISEEMQKWVNAIGKEVKFKWVRGHRPSAGSRGWVNDKIDKMIRSHYK